MVLPAENTTEDGTAAASAEKSTPRLNRNVLNVLNAIKNPADQQLDAAVKVVEASKVVAKKQPATKKSKLPRRDTIPRGKPKSGRPWKEVKQKFSGIKKSIYRHTTDKKAELRNELKHIKELSKSIKEDRKADNLNKKLRRAENAKKKLENERKSEIVQVIKNPAKLKRMKKKALRKIEKRDLSTIKTV